MHHKTIIFLLTSIASLLCSSSTSNFSGCWAFGDVVVDTGNNNFIPTFFRANFRPYGRDFPNRTATGRFNNGKVLVDFLCSGLGQKNVTPPYLDRTSANDQALITGVSFGSGGSGYDPLTPRLFNALSLSKQIDLFEEAQKRLRILVGEEMADSIVEKSLFLVTAGTADFSLFYDLRVRSLQFTISGYQDFVLQQVERTIQRLYNVGARRLFVSNLPLIGCLPIQITFAGGIVRRPCIERQNDDSAVYNEKFRLLLSRLEKVLSNSTIVPYDFYNFNLDVVTNPAKYGLNVTRRGCCGTGLFEVGPTCKEPFVKTCRDPSKYFFWTHLIRQKHCINLCRILV